MRFYKAKISCFLNQNAYRKNIEKQKQKQNKKQKKKQKNKKQKQKQNKTKKIFTELGFEILSGFREGFACLNWKRYTLGYLGLKVHFFHLDLLPQARENVDCWNNICK